MPRGCDNPNSKMNNGPVCDPWNWSPCARNGDPDSGYKSSQHSFRVLPHLGRFVISNERGAFSKGPGHRVRFFKTVGAAQVAANTEAGI